VQRDPARRRLPLFVGHGKHESFTDHQSVMPARTVRVNVLLKVATVGDAAANEKVLPQRADKEP